MQRLLNNKADFKDHFDFYNLDNFTSAYSNVFEIIEQKEIEGSKRVIFLLKKK